jgi:iron complex transport system ATP-binding protein
MRDGRRDMVPPWRLECRALSVRRGPRAVLQDVNLTIENGECISILGPNGVGKTTLLLALLGLLRPVSGTVRVNGTPVCDLPSAVRGRFATYLPQGVERLPAFRVFDVVAGGRYPHVPPFRPLSDGDRAIVAGALERCGIAALAERPVTELSGGERQKTLLAAAIAQDAELFMLDEPDTALDPAHQIELVRMLRSLRDEGRALVIVSHDLLLPAALGGRVIALRDGRIAADGAAGDVLRPDRLAEIYGAQFVAAATADGRHVVLPRL